jgi:surfactin synthase thioesterase subunit
VFRTSEKIVNEPVAADPPLTLFGFHPAGGSAAAFTGWQRTLGPRVRVAAVQLPGRGPDGRSARYGDLDSLARALDGELGPRLEAPHVFYGHSMGALVAHGLADLRVARGLRPPERLVVAGCPAPHRTSALVRVLHLTDQQAVRWMLDLRGVPAGLREDEGWLARRTAALREDIRVCGSPRTAASGRPLPCPIDVLAGSRDPLVPREDAAAWADHSAVGCTVRVVPGGHFFPRESPTAFFARFADALAGVDAL